MVGKIISRSTDYKRKAGGMGLVVYPKRNKLCSMCSPL